MFNFSQFTTVIAVRVLIADIVRVLIRSRLAGNWVGTITTTVFNFHFPLKATQCSLSRWAVRNYKPQGSVDLRSNKRLHLICVFLLAKSFGKQTKHHVMNLVGKKCLLIVFCTANMICLNFRFFMRNVFFKPYRNIEIVCSTKIPTLLTTSLLTKHYQFLLMTHIVQNKQFFGLIIYPSISHQLAVRLRRYQNPALRTHVTKK